MRDVQFPLNEVQLTENSLYVSNFPHRLPTYQKVKWVMLSQIGISFLPRLQFLFGLQVQKYLDEANNCSVFVGDNTHHTLFCFISVCGYEFVLDSFGYGSQDLA